jgi:hypothetical protein
MSCTHEIEFVKIFGWKRYDAEVCQAAGVRVEVRTVGRGGVRPVAMAGPLSESITKSESA